MRNFLNFLAALTSLTMLQFAGASPVPEVLTRQEARQGGREANQGEKPVGGTLEVQGEVEPPYRQYIEEKYGELTEQIDYDVMRGRIRDPRRLTWFAATSVGLYDVTGDISYLDHAQKTIDTLLDEWGKNSALIGQHSNDFFTLAPLLIAYERLREQGRADSSSESVMREAARIISRPQVSDDNQGFSRAAGAAQALRLFPDDPVAQDWSRYLDEIWDYWYSQKDTDENAGHYNSIALFNIIQIARLTGRESELLDPGVRRLFERFRDQVTPMGMVPEYGDDYFGAWHVWPYIFEYAARAFNDPTYRETAWRIFASGSRNFPHRSTPGNFDADLWELCNFFYLTALFELSPSSHHPIRAHAGSAVLLRNRPGFSDVHDKLILASSRHPGASYLMMELYGRGYHGHLNRIGAIQHYESGSIPFFHGLTRHNRSAVHSNIVALLPPGESFPHPHRSPDSGVWQTESIPARILAPGRPEETTAVTLDDLTLRLSASSEIDFIIDNLRLEGPGGVLMLDDFSDLNQWQRRDNPYSLTPDSNSDGTALKISVKPRTDIFYHAQGYDTTFSLSDYSNIKYDWKYEAATQTNFYKAPAPFIFRLWVDPLIGIRYHLDTCPGEVNQAPVVREATAENRAADSFGEVILDEYQTIDTSLKRQMILTEEGFLVIHDTIIPGPGADGYKAGPIWHLYSQGERGENWFSSFGEPRDWYSPEPSSSEPVSQHVLVYYEKAEGRTFGVERAKLSRYTPHTTFAKEVLVSGESTKFIMVVLPYDPSRSPSEVAGGVEVERGARDKVLVRVSRGNEVVEIGFDEDSWRVVRKDASP